MTAPSTAPLSMLARLVATRATGELIVAADALEVHVYLQAGRIAWGTTTAERFVFRRHLAAAYHLDEHALLTALEECQRTRRPLGETLVAWGLLTQAQVREGLRAQVASTLASLERCGGAQTLFLPRGANYASYDQQLTFELAELLPASALRGPPGRAEAALQQLQEAVPELLWAAAVSAGAVTASAGGAPPRAVADLARRLAEGVDLVAVRSSGGSLVGGTLPSAEQSVWCGLVAETSIGTALGAVASLAERPRPDGQACARGRFESFGETTHRTAGVAEMLDRAGCPVGAVVLDRSGTPDLWALARGPLAPHELGRLAALRQGVLDLDAFGVRLGVPGAALAFQSALVADERWWWFGTDLVTPEPSSLWLVLPRDAGQGLGWGLLATVARHLSTQEPADA